MSSKVVDMEERKGSQNWRKYIRGGVFFLLLIVIIGFLLTNIYIVKENEYRVVRQFGEVIKIVEDPGLHVKIPFVQSVTTLPKNQMKMSVEEAEINTKDKKRIIIDNYAVWKIEDPKKMIANAKTVVNAEAKMSEFIFSTIRSQLGKLDYDEIINDENESRGSLNDQVTETVNTLLDSNNFGIVVTDVRIKRTDLPNDNENSVYNLMISEREAKSQEYLSEGEAEKNRQIAETDREVKEMLAKAKAEAEAIRGEGEKEAGQIYNDSYSKDPEFYEMFRTLQSYKKTIDGETVIILPLDSPYANTLLGSE
ncbi:protease modulator HflC [Bacillus carboniphilus]|uniref:Protein HflC n=1 Tax=Bacillus carboniphilus TaxID=86663 RepID=A0ABY9JZF9_9BACI|nr:protease modulator HflC [Bacillus carboniphilus]WLR44159.1 protease modulator HflC [Bacillus carboniphilus]